MRTNGNTKQASYAGDSSTCVLVRALVRMTKLSGILAASSLCYLAIWSSAVQAQTPSRQIIDMAGVPVNVPQAVERVVTIGPVPVLNSLVFAVGEGGRIANGLPEFAKHPRWAYQSVFAPQITTLPALQNIDRTPNLEDLLNAKPDAVLTMDRLSAEKMRRSGIPALYLSWSRPEDVKKAVSLLGQLFSRSQAAARYVERFDGLIAMVTQRLAASGMTPPTVLYFNPATLTQPHLVAEWWIRMAGGTSVTDNGRSTESFSFNSEQMLAWDPDFLIVADRSDVDTVLREPRYRSLSAVRNRRILVTPCAAHTWGNRTAEQPLVVLWAAKQLHPDLFADIDLVEVTQSFYREIFGTALTKQQVEEILSGGAQTAPLTD